MGEKTTNQIQWKELDLVGEVGEEISLKSHNNLTINTFPNFFSVESNFKENPIVEITQENGKSIDEVIISPFKETNEKAKNSEKIKNSIQFSKPKKSKNHEGITHHQQTRITFLLVNKFIQNLKNSIIFKAKFKEGIIKVINDKSFYLEGLFSTRKAFSGWLGSFNFLKKFAFLKKNNLLIYPNSLFLICFDIILLIIILANLIIIPINLGFGISLNEIFFQINIKNGLAFTRFNFCIFVIDMVIHLNIPYFSQGGLIIDHNLIIAKYMKKCFLKDLLGILYFLFHCMGTKINFYFSLISGLLYLFMIDNMKRKIKHIEEFLPLTYKTTNLIAFLKLFLKFLFLMHIFSCFWIFCGKNTLEGSWLDTDNLINQDFKRQYISSFYYIMTLTLHIGFSDIIPQSYSEKVYTLIILFISLFYFAYNVYPLTNLLKKIHKIDHEVESKLDQATNFFKGNRVSFITKSKILSSLETLYLSNKIINDFENNKFIEDLPKSIQDELLEQTCGVLLKSFPLFKKNFSKGCLQKLCHEMEKIHFNPGKIICNQDLTNDSKIYFIDRGEVDIYTDTNQNKPTRILQHLKAGELFGEISFFSGKPIKFIAQASSCTTLYIIRKESFLKVLRENYDDYERFCQIKDNINLYDTYENFGYKCELCKETTHHLLNCMRCHLNKPHYQVSYIISENQKRQSFDRKHHKVNSLMNNHKYKLASLKLFNEPSYSFVMSSDDNSSWFQPMDEDELMKRLKLGLESRPNLSNLNNSIAETSQINSRTEKIMDLKNRKTSSLTSLGVENKRKMSKFKNSMKEIKEKTKSKKEIKKIKNELILEPLSLDFEEDKEIESFTKFPKSIINLKTEKIKEVIDDSEIISNSSISAEKIFLFTDILKEFKFYYPHNNFSKIFNKDNDFSTKNKNSFKNINKHNEQINDKKGMIIITKKLNSVLNKCVGRIKIF